MAQTGKASPAGGSSCEHHEDPHYVLNRGDKGAESLLDDPMGELMACCPSAEGSATDLIPCIGKPRANLGPGGPGCSFAANWWYDESVWVL